MKGKQTMDHARQVMVNANGQVSYSDEQLGLYKKNMGEPRYSRRVITSCFLKETSCINIRAVSCITLVTNKQKSNVLPGSLLTYTPFQDC